MPKEHSVIGDQPATEAPLTAPVPGQSETGTAAPAKPEGAPAEKATPPTSAAPSAPATKAEPAPGGAPAPPPESTGTSNK